MRARVRAAAVVATYGAESPEEVRYGEGVAGVLLQRHAHEGGRALQVRELEHLLVHLCDVTERR